MGEIIYLPIPGKPSIEQTQYWEQRLEDAEKAVEVALRMLGRMPLEFAEDGLD